MKGYKILKAKVKSFITGLFLIVSGLIIIFGVWTLITRMEGDPPIVSIKGLGDGIKSYQTLSIEMADEKSGLKKVQAFLEKDGKEYLLFDKRFPSLSFFSGFFSGGSVKKQTCDIPIHLKKINVSDGDALVRIVVYDYSWRKWWNGNQNIFEKKIVIDSRKPKIQVLSQQHYIRQGGSNLVIYKLSEPCSKSGVYVGKNFFPGYPAQKFLGKKAENVFMSFIALDHSQTRGTPLFVSASDRAGNTAKAGFYYYIINQKFKKDILKISDQFLNIKVPEFEDLLPESNQPLIQKFLWINRTFRKANTTKLKKIGQSSENKLYWKGHFLRMGNSARKANFADHREYRYNKEKVDQQIHMGIDLASVSRAPVPAANNGKVIFTGDVGIYGGTVVIDHGLGLLTTYSHLSSFNVEKDQIVSRGDIIANTGATGMAAGDHLHFGVIVHNTFVNPVEWWDKKWIKDNIMLKIKEAKKILGIKDTK